MEETNKQVGCHYKGVLGDKSVTEFSFLSGCPHHSNKDLVSIEKEVRRLVNEE